MSTSNTDITKFAKKTSISRQIQLRRGSTAEHAEFTGALGEVTFDTTAKTLRLHDGETPGGTPLARQSDLDAADYVIETYRKSDGSMWYRRYKSGWVVQGGTVTPHNDNAVSVNYAIAMADVNYTLLATSRSPYNTSADTPHGCHYVTKTTTGCVLMSLGGNNGVWIACETSWMVCGYAA